MNLESINRLTLALRIGYVFVLCSVIADFVDSLVYNTRLEKAVYHFQQPKPMSSGEQELDIIREELSK